MNNSRNKIIGIAALTAVVCVAAGAGYVARPFIEAKQENTDTFPIANDDKEAQSGTGDNYSYDKKSPRRNYKHTENNGDFDFYVLALSWSPTFCKQHSDAKSAKDQCQAGAGHGFVVHGLWPQFEHGYPRSCPSEIDAPSNGQIMQMLDIMPSPYLVRGEWEKHGTCSGLTAEAYFANLRKAHDLVKIPDISAQKQQSVAQLEQAFINANHGMEKDGIAIVRNGNMMSEVRICLSKDLQFRACDEVNGKASKDFDKLYIPPPL